MSDSLARSRPRMKTLTQTLSTDPPWGPLPVPAHCQILVNGLAYASTLPDGKVFKDWGRGLPNTATTMKLPKVFWLSRRGPSTCALDLDVIPSDLSAVENFTLKDVATVAERILSVCLYGRSQVGTELLGDTKRVMAKLVRADMPRIRKWKQGNLERLALRNGVELLTASLNSTN